MIKFKHFIILLSVCLVLACDGKTSLGVSTAEQYQYPELINVFDIYKKLDSAQYKQLDKDFHQLQLDYENDPSKGSVLYYAYSAFNKADDDFAKQLDAWVAKTGSYMAYNARGIHYYAKAWRARGNKFRNKTSDKQFNTMGDYFELAGNDFSVALDKYSNDLIVHVYQLHMIGATSSKDYLKKYFKASLELHPGSENIRSAYYHYLQKRWGGAREMVSEAMVELEGAQKQYPHLKILAGYDDYLKGRNHYKKFDKSLKYYNRAIEKINNIIYFANRGRVYYFNNHFELALKDFDYALSKNPYDIQYIRYRADTYYFLNDFKKAVSDIEYGLSLDKSNIRLLKTKAKILKKQKSYADAIKVYRTILDLTPYDEYITSNLAALYVNSKQFKLGKETAIKAIRLDPENSYSRRQLGIAEQGLKNYRGAIESYTKAIELGDKYSWGYRGDVYIDARDYAKALADFQQARKVEPDNLEIVRHINIAKQNLESL